MKKITILFLLFSALSNAQNNWEQIIINPGNNASKPMFMTEYNGNLYFQARGLNSDVELFKTDGTQAGTTLVSDIMNVGNYPENFTVFQNQLFFTASNQLYGRELFKTDGTTVTLVKDINVGIANSQTFTEENQTAMLEHNGFLYFFADDDPSATNDWDLWKTDGTTAGTTKVLEFNTLQTFGFKKNFKLIDGKFYFMKKVFNNTLLYQYNPANEVLTELANLVGDIDYLTEFENKLFFNNSNTFYNLYYTNGVLNSNNGYINLVSNIGSRQMKALGSNLFFVGSNFNIYKCNYDGTNNEYTTTLVYDFSGNLDPFFNQTGNGADEIFVEYNNKLYFTAKEATSPTNASGGKIIQIYSTDGLNTQVAVPINNLEFESYSGNFIKKMTLINNTFYFMMYDFPNFSYHLWKANPADGSYQQLSFPNVATTPKNIAFEHESKPYNVLKWFNNSLYMGAFTTAEEKELWKFSDSSVLSSSQNDLNNNVSIYPNPTSGIVTIQSDLLTNFNVEIYDILGKKINEYRKKTILDISNYNSGIYFLKIIDLEINSQTIKKIVKQ